MALPITPETTQFITLQELKDHLNIPQTSFGDDTELDLHRGAAQEHVEALIGPVLQREVVETYTTRYGGVVLFTPPVLSVTSVTASDVALTGYTSVLGLGMLSGLTSRNVTVTYTAGRTSCPDAVRLAALIIAGHLWELQRGASSPSGALPVDAFDQAAPTGLGYLVPNRALELLSPYLLAPGIA